MRDPNGRPAKLLVAYYGLIEAAHIVVLALAGVRLARTGTIGFPIPPPPEGWAEQLYPFFVAMGAVDALNVVVAWAFVYGYFSRARWRWWAGCVTLTVAMYSAIVFAWGTLASGAWSHHPADYLALVAAFVPVAALAVAFAAWIIDGQLLVSKKV